MSLSVDSATAPQNWVTRRLQRHSIFPPQETLASRATPHVLHSPLTQVNWPVQIASTWAAITPCSLPGHSGRETVLCGHKPRSWAEPSSGGNLALLIAPQLSGRGSGKRFFPLAAPNFHRFQADGLAKLPAWIGTGEGWKGPLMALSDFLGPRRSSMGRKFPKGK